VIISPAATSPALTAIDVTAPNDEMPGLLWRTAPPDSLQGQVIASDLVRRAVTDVAVIHVSGAYGEGLAAEFQESFTGGTVMLFPFTNATERDTAVSTVAEGTYQEVIFIASAVTDTVAFFNAAAVLAGYNTKNIFLTDAAANSDLLTMTRATASALYPRVRGTRPSTPRGSVYMAFASSYAVAYPGTPVDAFSFTAHTYDATWMTIYGSAWAIYQGGVIDGLNIARGYRHLVGGTGVNVFTVVPSALPGISQAFRNAARVEITGASGALDYDLATEETVAPIDLWVIAADGSAIMTESTVDPGTL
jgi:branched-chain amino acid transport system substrate-binding protein